MTPLRSIVGLLVWVGLSFAAGAIGSLFTGRAIPGWYAGLVKPSWNPPNWLFGPVWSALYLLMGISAWLVWRRAGLSGAALPLGLFALQLCLNAAWSIIFFGLHAPGAALVDIVLLWAAILATVLAFRPVVPVASLLLLPYLLWVTFAGFLNFALWRLNR